MATDASVINAIGFNCKGIKSNFNYVEHLLQNECDTGKNNLGALLMERRDSLR